MIAAQLPSRASTTLFRLLLLSAILLVVLLSGRYYLPTAHDASLLFVHGGQPSSVPVSEDIKLGDPKLPSESTLGAPLESSTSICPSIPGAEEVLVVVKTGATEIFHKLPEQLLTHLRCIPNLMIFSDLEQEIGDYHIYSALDEVSDEYKDNHEDFEFYRKMRKYQAEHQDLSALSSENGWNLDKWKFIPILHKVYQEQPNTKWFVFIEADTFLSWTNLLQLLSRLDPTEPLYFGSAFVLGDTVFAHGGTGYVISNAAAKKFEDIHDQEHIAKWELETSNNCCGDAILAVAFLDAGVPLTPAWPLVQGESPSTLDWSERVWCTPAVTWHHVHPFEIEALWEFEQTWFKQIGSQGKAPQIPYLYKDVFEYFVQPHITANRSDWNNLSRGRTFTQPSEDHAKEGTEWDDLSHEGKQAMWGGLSDIEKQSIESAEACYAACEADEECLQYFFKPGSCHLDKVVRLGKVVDAKKEKDTVSGWMPDRIADFKQRQPPCVPAWDLNT
ncbi:hypothetical protein H2201_009037 [Coniosporium apollinis]|uniref:N-acetylgalactosaminide beta-1,3-galactosyltransferase n=1 Tax=Coniosporium apollinis TaxID=61459 RepID=A0ABQ9NF96_9PEZI|nr:hypothetical protein H2201_009037 [Coniosporium apollinis]